MPIDPTKLTAIELLLNTIAAWFLPPGAIVVLKDAEIAYNIITGAIPVTDPVLAGTLTNRLGSKFGLYIVPIGAPGTSVTISF